MGRILKLADKMTEEQRNWYNKQMGSRKVGKDRNGDKKPDETVYKYSSKGDGILRESVLITGVPYFIKKSFLEKNNEYCITLDPHIEETTKILKPPFKQICPFIPYEFASNEEPNQYFKRALKETPDTLIAKIKALIKLVNEIDDNTATLLSVTIFNSYFQDRFSTVYYIIVVGANGTGKSAFGETFECLGYRAVKQNNATPAFWFRVFWTNEAGQVTIVAEEVDKMDENGEVMGMLKEGYQPNSKVPRMSNDNSKMEFFYPFSFKIMIGEKSPGEDKARGLLDRSFKTKSYKGYPDFDIKDIRNPQGNPERQKHLDAFNDLRKLLLAYRIVHFKDPYKEIDIGLDGRDKELCKPTLQLFYTLGASKELLEEIAKTLQHFLDIKNKRKGETLEAVTYPIIINLVSKYGNEIPSGQIWREITGTLEGQVDDNKPNVWDSADFGRKYRNTVIKMICDKFGAEISHTEKGNNLIFDPNYLKKMEKIYRSDIKIKPIDDPDALTHLTHPDGTRPLLNDDIEDQEENQDNVPSSRQSASDESVNQDKEVKCPSCDYVEHPFYLKIHVKNAHGEQN
jgi:hypothetical protein